MANPANDLSELNQLTHKSKYKHSFK